MRKSTSLLASLALSIFLAASANAALVDLELSLLVDVSGSVSASEYNLQMGGYVDAFDSDAVWNAISNGVYGSIAVNMVQWSGSTQQNEVVGWMLIDDQQDAYDFADAVAAVTRKFSGSTAIGSALETGTDWFSTAYDGTRSVIDVSGDGANNNGIASSVGRDYALANGVDAINGIVIGGGLTVFNHYKNEVIGGTGSFVLAVNDFAGFGTAIQDKLIKEIITPPPNGVPEPATMLLFGTGLVGLVGIGTRRKKRNS